MQDLQIDLQLRVTQLQFNSNRSYATLPRRPSYSPVVYYSIDVFKYILRETTRMFHIGMIWRPPSQSELTPIIFDLELTHLGSEVSI